MSSHYINQQAQTDDSAMKISELLLCSHCYEAGKEAQYKARRLENLSRQEIFL